MKLDKFREGEGFPKFDSRIKKLSRILTIKRQVISENTHGILYTAYYKHQVNLIQHRIFQSILKMCLWVMIFFFTYLEL